MAMQITRLSAEASVEEIVSLLKRDGFAIVERYLSPEDVRAKKEDLQRVIRSTPTGRNDFEGFSTQRIYALFAKTRVFDAQAVDPLVLGVLERVLGQGFVLSRHPRKYLDDGRRVSNGVVEP